MSARQQINITVDGHYDPAEVALQQGVPAQLTFTRTSTQGCLAQVHSTDLHFTTELPLDQPQTVTAHSQLIEPVNFTLVVGWTW